MQTIIPITKTPKYIAESIAFQNNQSSTGLAQLVAYGPRDWLKPHESWEDLLKERYNYYYENGLTYAEESSNGINKHRTWLKDRETWDQYITYLCNN